ncbi:MAG: arsenate reductase ArsC, partial [Spirochaetia bacterium]
MAEKRRILFICVHNSARSQMAEEYTRKLAGDIFEAESAGLEPGELNPLVVQVLQEDGIDISGKKPQSVFELYSAGKTYSYVITVCSREAEEKCPIFPGAVNRLSWPFPDPTKLEGSPDEKLLKTREIRDVIKEEVRQFTQAY